MCEVIKSLMSPQAFDWNVPMTALAANAGFVDGSAGLGSVQTPIAPPSCLVKELKNRE
jgi:hypothetical protein